MKKLLFIIPGALFLALLAPAFGQNIGWERDWFRTPFDAEYLTDNHSQRTVAYNPDTGNLLVVNRAGGLSVHILDSDSGDEIGQLSVEGVSGGNFPLNKIRVADDGVIYAANLTTDTAGGPGPFKIYRWADEGAEPEVIFSGDPSDGKNAVLDDDEEPLYHEWSRRWGDILDVRGGGESTQILVASRNEIFVSVLTTENGEDFDLHALMTDLPADANSGRFYNSVAFGEGDTFWGSAGNHPLEYMEFDLEEETATSIGSYDADVFPERVGPVGVDAENGYLGAIRTDNRQILLYDISTLSETETNTPLAVYNQSTDNDNGNWVGDVAFAGDGRVFALETNNELVAFTIGPITVGDVIWANQDAIRTSAIDGGNPRTLVSGLQRPIGVIVDAVNGHIYWAENGAGRIARSNIDGTEVTTIADGRVTPQFLLMHGDRLYWSEFSDGLFSSDLDGGDIQHLIDQSDSQTAAIAVDRDADQIYLVSADDGTLWRVNADGSGDVEEVDTLVGGVYGLFVDEGSESLYVSSFGEDLVQVYDLDTGSITDLYTDRQLPLGITLSDDGSTLFWAERIDNADQSDGHIFFAAADGSGEVESILSGENSPFGIALMPGAAPESFNDWIARFELPAGMDGLADDPDGDGVSNLAEYALRFGNPTVPASAMLPVIGTEAADDQEFLSLTVVRNASAVGVSYEVEVSSNLLDWESGEEHTTVVLDDRNVLIVRDNTPMTDANRRFIRLRLSAD